MAEAPPVAVDHRRGAGARGAAIRRPVPWLDTWNTLADADWRLLAAAGALNLLSLALKAWAWQLLLRPLGAGPLSHGPGRDVRRARRSTRSASP